MIFTPRPYHGPADLQAMLALVKSRPAEQVVHYPSPADLRELLERPEIQAAARIWETPAGRLAGYALINYALTYADLAFEYAAEFAGRGLGDAMVSWGEQAYRERFHGQTTELTSAAHSEQPERIALLERHGFSRAPESLVHMARSLNEPIASPAVPESFTLRPIRGETETDAWIALHRAAFGTENMTAAGRLSMTHARGYNPDLDLVIVAPDGTLAAYLFGTIHPDENELTGKKVGNADTSGTLPVYRCRGLCSALLLVFLDRIKQCGMETASLQTSSANVPMQKAGLSVGFRVIGQSWHYAKPLSQIAVEHGLS